MFYLFEEMEHPEEIREAVKTTDKVIREAMLTAMESENPVDGYKRAVDLVEMLFEDMEAPQIVGTFETEMRNFLNTRVKCLMYAAKHNDGSVNERGKYPACHPEGCLACEGGGKELWN